jgi:hypothetical protein
MYEHTSPGMLTAILAVFAGASALPMIARKIENNGWVHGIFILLFCLLAAGEIWVIHISDEASTQRFTSIITTVQQIQQNTLAIQQSTGDLPKILERYQKAKSERPANKPTLQAEALGLSKDILSFISAQEGTMPQLTWPRTDASNAQDIKNIQQYSQATLSMYDHDFGPRIAQLLGKAKSEHADYTAAQNACSVVNNFFAMRGWALALSGVSAKDLPGRIVMQRPQPSQ